MPDTADIIPDLAALIREAFARQASDVLLTARAPAMVRIDGEWRAATRAPLSHEQRRAAVFALLDERARAGIFLAFQYPCEIPGVSIANFIRAAMQARLKDGEELDATGYYKQLYAQMDSLKIDRKFTSRAVNDGFSGGEKKRCEILQMAMLKPRFAFMDETDSGLDIDALRIVSEGIEHMRGADLGILLITHYQRLLNHIVPDFVHVMYDGRIVKSGDKSLALELEAKGYDWVKTELAAS